MAYALLTSLGKAKRSLSAAASMLRGFNLVCPLTDIEKKHLRLLVASRLACSVTLGAYSYQQNPGNEYLLLHAQPAWDALTLIWSRGKSGPMAEAIDDLFRAACMAKPPAATGNTCTIDCSDIAMPDPDVPDLLSSVRTQATTNGANDGGGNANGPPVKKAKLDEASPVVTFVTGNKKKLEEVKRILSADGGSGSGLPFEMTNHKLDLPELQGDTLHIAKEKC